MIYLAASDLLQGSMLANLGELQDFKHVEYVELAFSSTVDPMSSGNTALQTEPWH